MSEELINRGRSYLGIQANGKAPLPLGNHRVAFVGAAKLWVYEELSGARSAEVIPIDTGTREGLLAALSD